MKRDITITVNFNWLLLAIAAMVVLKLTGVIALSWLWVFLWPIIGFVVIGAVFFLVLFLIFS